MLGQALVGGELRVAPGKVDRDAHLASTILRYNDTISIRLVSNALTSISTSYSRSLGRGSNPPDIPGDCHTPGIAPLDSRLALAPGS